MTATKSESTNHFIEFGSYLAKQFSTPVCHPTFWVYLLIAVIGAGGLGMWVAVFQQDMKAFVASLYTYFPAVAMASGFELILRDDQRKFVRSVAFATAFILILTAVLIAGLPVGNVSLGLGIFGYFLSLSFWWIANADNVVLHDTLPPNAAIGGKVDQPTKGELGDLNG